MPFDLLAPKHYINQINIYENEKVKKKLYLNKIIFRISIS